MPVNLAKTTAAAERAVLRAFTETIQSIKDQAIISEIANLINTGNVDGIVGLLQLDPSTFRPLENAITAAYEAGGATGAAQIGRIPTGAGTLVARFDVRNPRAEQWIKTLSSKRIVEIADETRTVVRNVLTSALTVGRGPRATALDLVGRIDPVTRTRTGGFIGLTDNQAQWVINARRDLETLNPNYLTRELRDRRLDGVFKRAMESGKPMSASQIDTAVTRYQARAVRYRGQTIAQTESLSALTAGQDEAIRQALDVGEVEEEFTRKYWRHTGAGKEPRESHQQVEMDYPDGLPPDEPFNVGGELMQGPRADGASAENVIWCHCQLVWKINFAGQSAKEIRGFR